MKKIVINMLIHNNVINAEDKAIYEYGFFVLWFNLLIIVSFFIQGILSSNIVFTLLFLVFYLPLRIYLGGYHCQTPLRCFIASNILYMTILFVYQYCAPLYIYSLIGIVLVYMLQYKYERKNYIVLTIIIIEILLSLISQIRIYILMSFLTNIFLYVTYFIDKRFQLYIKQNKN